MQVLLLKNNEYLKKIYFLYYFFDQRSFLTRKMQKSIFKSISPEHSLFPKNRSQIVILSLFV